MPDMLRKRSGEYLPGWTDSQHLRQPFGHRTIRASTERLNLLQVSRDVRPGGLGGLISVSDAVASVEQALQLPGQSSPSRLGTGDRLQNVVDAVHTEEPADLRHFGRLHPFKVWAWGQFRDAGAGNPVTGIPSE